VSPALSIRGGAVAVRVVRACDGARVAAFSLADLKELEIVVLRHVRDSRYSREATSAVPRINFPVVHSIAAIPALVSVAAVAASAVAIVGCLAAGVSPAVALGD
jgi:hypothetical protein